MSHLKQYPSTESLRSLISQEKIDALVADLSDHYRTEDVARYNGKITADVMRVWANLYDEIQSLFRDVEMGRDLTITRKLSRLELEDIVLGHEASNRYYHPGDYPEYTDEDIAE